MGAAAAAAAALELAVPLDGVGPDEVGHSARLTQDFQQHGPENNKEKNKLLKRYIS